MNPLLRNTTNEVVHPTPLHNNSKAKHVSTHPSHLMSYLAGANYDELSPSGFRCSLGERQTVVEKRATSDIPTLRKPAVSICEILDCRPFSIKVL